MPAGHPALAAEDTVLDLAYLFEQIALALAAGYRNPARGLLTLLAAALVGGGAIGLLHLFQQPDFDGPTLAAYGLAGVSAIVGGVVAVGVVARLLTTAVLAILRGLFARR